MLSRLGNLFLKSVLLALMMISVSPYAYAKEKLTDHGDFDSRIVRIDPAAAAGCVVVAVVNAPTPAVAHSVTLTWNASTDTVTGYNVYRATVSGGPYTLLTATPVSALTFTDTAVAVGQTLFYVVRATVGGIESVNSNEANALIRPAAPVLNPAQVQ